MVVTYNGPIVIVFCLIIAQSHHVNTIKIKVGFNDDFFSFECSDRFICDDWNLVKNYLDDGKYTDGLDKFIGNYSLLGKIINGEVPGRASEDEFVIASSHGIAISDVAVGDMILKKAEEKGIGTMLTLMADGDTIR